MRSDVLKICSYCLITFFYISIVGMIFSESQKYFFISFVFFPHAGKADEHSVIKLQLEKTTQKVSFFNFCFVG